jgi:hypothetical protein
MADPFLFDNRATISLGLHCMPFRAADSRRHRVVAYGIQRLRLDCWRGLAPNLWEANRSPLISINANLFRPPIVLTTQL